MGNALFFLEIDFSYDVTYKTYNMGQSLQIPYADEAKFWPNVYSKLS